MKYVKSKLGEKKGASMIVFAGLLLLVVTISCVVMEYFRVTGMVEALNLELERTGNIAVEYAMIDEARGYQLSRITPEIAKERFDTYFRDHLGLTSDYKKIRDGEMAYQVVFDRFDIDADSAQITMEGSFKINLLFVSEFAPEALSFPFYVVTKNVNTAD